MTHREFRYQIAVSLKMRYMPPAPIRSLISRSELRLDRTKNHMPIRGDTLCCQMCLLKYAIRSRTKIVLSSEPNFKLISQREGGETSIGKFDSKYNVHLRALLMLMVLMWVGSELCEATAVSIDEDFDGVGDGDGTVVDVLLPRILFRVGEQD
ncbi:hypothetical protein EVAR_3616_1 [Eumeta japonica]|uniref:Uncharacterized protein n=1 Tax=Eumeta variegata TaxID=151549 RepID=A0A4C1SWH6_EUMVA|nr:hypothetical protein EVAR_3616_1 [Eumeta japonica]